MLPDLIFERLEIDLHNLEAAGRTFEAEAAKEYDFTPVLLEERQNTEPELVEQTA